MRRRQRRRHDDTEAALANFALTFAKALLVFCVVLFVMTSSQSKTEDGIKPKMEYMLSAQWDGELDYDVDVWMRDPDGRILYYKNREVGFLNLERDDLGYLNSVQIVDGRRVAQAAHEEIVAVRGIRPGEYILNLVLYRAEGHITPNEEVDPVTVTVRIDHLNPTVKSVFRGKAALSRVGQGVHVLRFTIEENGDVTGLTRELPLMLMNMPREVAPE